MVDEVATTAGNGLSEVKAENSYQPLSLNLGVWWNMKEEGSKTSLSVNMVRDGLVFNFGYFDETNTKQVIYKKLSKPEVFMFVNMFRSFLADRMAIAKAHYESETDGPIQYSVLPELNCQVNNLFFSKEKNDYEVSSTMTLGTVEVNGVQRMAISIHTNDGKHVRVIFYENRGRKLVQISKHTVIDPEDIQFLLFCMEIEKSLGKTVEYAGFDKLYQMLKRVLNLNGGSGSSATNSGSNKSQSFFGGFWKKNNDNTSRVEVNDSGSDADADLFGGIDSF